MSINTIWEKMDSENIKQISEQQVTAVIWWGKWDEWKWGDAYNLALNIDYELVLWLIWWPNAWHTVIRDDWKKFVGHNLPGAALTGKEIFLGQGKYINIMWMFDEIINLQQLWVNTTINIACWAHCLFPSFHWILDGAIENAKKENWNDVGTTLSGMWPWVATRWLRNSIPIWKLLEFSNNDLKTCIKELLAPFNLDFFKNIKGIEDEIISHKLILNHLKSIWFIKIVNYDFASKKYQEGKKMIIEWAQSPSLWMYGWSYPYNTSTDTSFLGILSSAWIVPEIWRVWEILVAKVFPSAVWNHEFPERVSHIYPELLEKENKFWTETGEYWATTKRQRMVAFPSPALIAEYIKNDPYVTAISLRKLDVLTKFKEIIWFPELPIITWYDESWKPLITNSSYNPEEVINTYKETINNIVWNEKWTNLPFILWFGPKPKESRLLIS